MDDLSEALKLHLKRSRQSDQDADDRANRQKTAGTTATEGAEGTSSSTAATSTVDDNETLVVPVRYSPATHFFRSLDRYQEENRYVDDIG